MRVVERDHFELGELPDTLHALLLCNTKIMTVSLEKALSTTWEHGATDVETAIAALLPATVRHAMDVVNRRAVNVNLFSPVVSAQVRAKAGGHAN
jgi:hypothetical protein